MPERTQIKDQKAQLEISVSCRSKITGTCFRAIGGKQNIAEKYTNKDLGLGICFGRRHSKVCQNSQDKAMWITEKTNETSKKHSLSFRGKGGSADLQKNFRQGSETAFCV